MAITTSNRRTKFDADGNGDAFSVPHDAKRNISVLGNDGGGTVKLQVCPGLNETDTEEWQDFPSASWTGEVIAVFDIPAGRYRWSLSGSTTPGVVAIMGE